MWLKALFLFQKFSFSRVIATCVGKMKILDYFMIANGKRMCKKALFLCQKFYFSRVINTLVEKWRYYFILWLQMVKNVIKGSFPMSKVLVFEGNS